MSELQRCRELLTDLHSRVAQLERGQATAPTALRPLDTASHERTRRATTASAASYINQPLSQSATTAVSSVPSPSQHMTASNRPFVTAVAAVLGMTPTRTQADV